MHQPLDVCLFPHHLRFPPQLGAAFFCIWPAGFFLHVGHIIVTLLNCIIENGRMRLRRAGRTERDGKRERDSPHQMEGEFNLHSLGGGSRVCPALLWVRLPTSASSCLSELRVLHLFASGFLPFFFLLQCRLITAQSDAQLIEPEGGRALFCGPIKSRTCCSWKKKKKKRLMLSEPEKKVALDTRF